MERVVEEDMRHPKSDLVGETHIHLLISVVAQKDHMWPQNASLQYLLNVLKVFMC